MPFRSILFLCLSSLLAAAEGLPPSFTLDVLPYLTKAGCNGGSCHSKADGQNNFKLSVFGYDPASDHAEIVMDDRGRRLLLAAPEESLLLKKATGAVPHEGGARLTVDSPGYRAVLAWLRAGAPAKNEGETTLKHIVVTPGEVEVRGADGIALNVVAHYADGSTRNVTGLAEYIVGERDIASVNEHGKVNFTGSVGEAIAVVRYMGHVGVSRMTVPPQKIIPATTYAALPASNEIDRLAYARMQKLGLLPSDLCTDGEFLRRASLDLIGKLPAPELTQRFLADPAPDKRAKLVDLLLEDSNYADHWAVKWGDLIRPNPSRVGVKPVLLLDQWLRSAFAKNMPYDEMVGSLLTAAGSTHQAGPVAIFRDKREPIDAASFVSQIFLGVRLDCARCHHHPSEKWTQEEYYQMAAFFARMSKKGQGISAPISGEPEYWWPAASGSISHPITEVVMTPKAPDGPEMPYVDGQDPRKQLVEWMSASNNPFFAKALVNRFWSEFFGRGMVDPVDDFRASNPASNEELLNWLAQDFSSHGYDIKHLLRTMTSSRLYQLSSLPNATNRTDLRNYSRSQKRRLSAEVLADAVSDLTGTLDGFEGLPGGVRAVKTWNHKLPSDFLDAFGRPNASQECPCERERKSSVVQALHVMNSDKLQDRIAHGEGRLTKLIKSSTPEPEIIRQLYLAAYCRLPTSQEHQATLRHLNRAGLSREQALQDVMWSLLNSAEFIFNH